MFVCILLIYLQPTGLKKQDFTIYIKTEGKYAGRKCLKLKGLNTDKTVKLSLSNATLRDEEGFHDMIEDPEDPLCLVDLFIRLMRHFPSNWNGTILRRPKTWVSNALFGCLCLAVKFAYITWYLPAFGLLKN